MARRAEPAKPRKRSKHYLEPGAYERRQQRRRERDLETDESPRYAGDGRWWTHEECSDEVTRGVWGWCERLKWRQRRRALLDALWEAIYRDTPTNMSDVDAGTVALRTKRARQNIAKSMVDTVAARVSKRRPMPSIGADDAGFVEKLFARRASRVLRRKMGSSLVERIRPLIARDGIIRGTGVAKAYRKGGDVSVERVPRRELVVDPVEAQYGTPRTLAQVKRMDRAVLRGMFPDPEAQALIADAARASYDEWRLLFEESTDVDHVDIVEAWHLPSVPGATDGRHIICVRGGAPLLDEPWTRERFPFSFFHWEPPIDGFWGTGLIESLAPIQQEVNALLEKMGEGIIAQMSLKVLLQRGSGVEKQHLLAGHPIVLEHDGPAPAWIAPTPFSPAVLQYLQWRISQAYELSGISQASAASKNPLGGANASGKAIDTMYDLESDRFGDKELGYSMFAVDLGLVILDEARAIAEDSELEAATKAAWIREIDWAKVEVDGGPYHVVAEPINFLPDSRAGKLSQVAELAKAGLLENGGIETLALFDEPDLARANRHLLGPYRMIERWCEELADVDVPLEDLTPTPLMVAQGPLAVRMCTGELCNVIAEGADEVVQGRFRWALSMLETETARLSQPPQGSIPPPGADAAGAPPMAPPMPGEMPPAGPPGMPPMPMPMPMMGQGPMDPMAAAAPGALPLPVPPGLDPMGGLTAQLAAGMPAAPPGMVMSQ